MPGLARRALAQLACPPAVPTVAVRPVRRYGAPFPWRSLPRASTCSLRWRGRRRPLRHGHACITSARGPRQAGRARHGAASCAAHGSAICLQRRAFRSMTWARPHLSLWSAIR